MTRRSVAELSSVILFLNGPVRRRRRQAQAARIDALARDLATLAAKLDASPKR